MKLIESKTLGTAAASIEFTSIPQDGTDLYLAMSCRVDGGGYYSNGAIRFNGNTGSNYTSRLLYGLGSSVGSEATTTDRLVYVYSTGVLATSNTFGNVGIYIPNYTSSAAKSVSIDNVSESNHTESIQAVTAGLWNQTAAITSITFLPQSGANFLAGSIISLYKITKGSDGIVTTS